MEIKKNKTIGVIFHAQPSCLDKDIERHSNCKLVLQVFFVIWFITNAMCFSVRGFWTSRLAGTDGFNFSSMQFVPFPLCPLSPLYLFSCMSDSRAACFWCTVTVPTNLLSVYCYIVCDLLLLFSLFAFASPQLAEADGRPPRARFTSAVSSCQNRVRPPAVTM